jgi:glycosyltransferase involved in cell wall biosynthesis
MRILIINSRYFLSAGPEKYLFSISEVLERHGHIVIPFSTHNSKNKKTQYSRYFVEPIGGGDLVYFKDYKMTPRTVAQMVGRQFYSFEVKRKLDSLIKATKPDVAYVLHHANKLGPSVIDACKENGVPVVMRLSDFFLVCSVETLFRDGHVCEECIDHTLWRGVLHRCLKKSLPLALMRCSAMALHRLMGYYQNVDAVISPSEFTIKKVTKVIDRKRLHFIPTLILPTEKENTTVGDCMLYVGRIEEHKGIMDAIRAVQGTKMRLRIVGSSSTGYDLTLKDYVVANSIRNVELTGAKYGEELSEEYRNARAVVIPTAWYENLPNVALEAMLYSRPIVATRLGSMIGIVKDGHNGLLYKPGDHKELSKKLSILAADNRLCRRLSRNSYAEAITTYDPERHYQRLMSVFENVVK